MKVLILKTNIFYKNGPKEKSHDFQWNKDIPIEE